MLKSIFKLASYVTSIAAILLLSLTGTQIHEQALYRYKGDSVVMLRDRTFTSGGTGFQVQAPSGKQYILTNRHVCELGEILYATSQSGKTEEVKVIEMYDRHDLCLVEKFSNLDTLKIADRLFKREKIFLIGHPGHRQLTLQSGYFVGTQFIQVLQKCKDGEVGRRVPGFCLGNYNAAHINAISYGGNSGSPVLDSFGKVVGVLFAGSRSQPTASYMVTLEAIQKFLKEK